MLTWCIVSLWGRICMSWWHIIPWLISNISWWSTNLRLIRLLSNGLWFIWSTCLNLAKYCTSMINLCRHIYIILYSRVMMYFLYIEQNVRLLKFSVKLIRERDGGKEEVCVRQWVEYAGVGLKRACTWVMPALAKLNQCFACTHVCTDYASECEPVGARKSGKA